MTDSREKRTADRRSAAVRGILEAAWSLMAREGVATLSVREVARSIGIRQQSLTYYFPTKQTLLDALFADGFRELWRVLDGLPLRDDVDEAVVDVAVAVVDFCVAEPARYHLMFQRTVPGFEPSSASHEVALGVLSVLVDRLEAAGVTKDEDLALVRSLISGLAAEQSANEPGGRIFADQTRRGISALLAAVRA